MNLHANFGRVQLSSPSYALGQNMYIEMRWMREQIMEILEAIYKLIGRPKPQLRDNQYVRDRLGVSDRTIRRFIEKGDLRVAQTINKFNYYLADDVEELYRMYRG